jgi:hypothetical protein
LLIKGFVLFEALDLGFGAELWRRWEDAMLAQSRVEVLVGER